jgi:hypothetical protein
MKQNRKFLRRQAVPGSRISRWWFALIAGVLLGGIYIQPHRAQALTSDALDGAILSTTELIAIAPDPKDAKKVVGLGSCTGTFVTPDGLILTSFHCVGQTDLYGPDDTGLGLKNGDFYYPKGLVLVAPTIDAQHQPKLTYLAQFYAGSTQLDVAVLKIVDTLDKNTPLPNPLPILPGKLGDSTKVKISDPVGIIGYPGVGGDLITVTEGKIAGFEDEDGDGNIDSFKTDAKISPGNSGGLAINDAGEQIGIPTYEISKGAASIGRIKMVAVTLPFIQIAEQGTPTAPQTSGTPQQNPTPSAPPSNPTTQGVVLQGTVVDADTQRGIPDALFVVLNPGTTFQNFKDSGFDNSLIAANATTDQDGAYTTAPPLPRGHDFTVIIVADGYTGRYFDNGLTLAPTGSTLFKLDPIALQKK